MNFENFRLISIFQNRQFFRVLKIPDKEETEDLKISPPYSVLTDSLTTLPELCNASPLPLELYMT